MSSEGQTVIRGTVSLASMCGNLNISTLGSMYSSIVNTSIAKHAELLTMFDYSGFSPHQIHERIVSLGRAAGKSDEVIGQDIASLILIFLRRGSKISKMIGKCTEEAQAILTSLSTVYAVKDNNDKTPNCITLIRICSTYPPLVLKIAQQYRPRSALELDFSNPLHLLSLPGAAGCIPRNQRCTRLLIRLVDDYQDAMNDLFVRWHVKTQPYARGKFTSIAINGPVTNEMRIETLRQVGILNRDGTVVGYEGEDGNPPPPPPRRRSGDSTDESGTEGEEDDAKPKTSDSENGGSSSDDSNMHGVILTAAQEEERRQARELRRIRKAEEKKQKEAEEEARQQLHQNITERLAIEQMGSKERAASSLTPKLADGWTSTRLKNAIAAIEDPDLSNAAQTLGFEIPPGMFTSRLKKTIAVADENTLMQEIDVYRKRNSDSPAVKMTNAQVASVVMTFGKKYLGLGLRPAIESGSNVTPKHRTSGKRK